MPKKSEAIVFIAGTDSKEKNMNLNRLVQGLVNTTEGEEVEEVGKCSVGGEKGIRLTVRPYDSSERILDVYEAHWGDLIPTLDEQSPLQKMKTGFSVLTFWFISRIWRSVRNSPYMLVGVTLSSFLLMMWYYGVLALAFTAVGTNPELLPIAADANTAAIMNSLVTTIGKIGTVMGGWYVWAFASMLMVFLPISSLVNIANFTKRYLCNEVTGNGVGLKDKIRNRVLETLQGVVREDTYERVTIVAHSFGTVIGVDILADYQHTGESSIRFMTLGSPLRFMSYRSEWIKNELKKGLSNTSIDMWIDYYADGDWLCTKVPGHGETQDQESRKLMHEASLVEKLMGKTHLSYFTSQEVMEELIS